MNDATYADIVEKLVKLREAHHIGTNDMADYVGVTRQSIYNFESGSRQSYKILLSYLTHPAFSMEELKDIYDLMGG
jgi:DNA-binding XRE family transcriptional regulator